MQLCTAAGVDVVCEECHLTMQKIPSTSYRYSDHEGVEAMFTVRRNVTGNLTRRCQLQHNRAMPSVILL